jgi:hypothetical protein
MATPPPVHRPTGAVYTNGFGMFSPASMQERRRVRRPTAAPAPSPRQPTPPVRTGVAATAAGRQIIQIHRSDDPGSVPTGLQPGELAVEYASDPVKMWVGVEAAVDPSLQKELKFAAAGFPALLTDPLTIPDIGDTVDAEVDDAGMLATGMVVFIGGALFAITAIVAETVTLLRLDSGGELAIVVHSGPAPPDNPTTGTLWYDTGNTVLMIRIGGTWRTL